VLVSFTLDKEKICKIKQRNQLQVKMGQNGARKNDLVEEARPAGKSSRRNCGATGIERIIPVIKQQPSAAACGKLSKDLQISAL
jgi:hypothetical protein